MSEKSAFNEKCAPNKKAYLSLTFFCTRPIWGLIPVRIAFGTILILHGVARLLEVRRNTGAFIEDLPGELAFAIVLVFAVIEILSGTLIIPGLLTRAAGMLTVVSILISLVIERLPLGFEYGFQFELLAIVVANMLMMSGPGRYSLDRLIARRLLRQYESVKHEAYTIAETPYTKWWE